MSSQMRRDLSERCGERLRQWVSDSEQLFEMGELKRTMGQEAILAQLMYATTVAIATWMHPKIDGDFIAVFEHLLKEAREEIAKQKRENGR